MSLPPGLQHQCVLHGNDCPAMVFEDGSSGVSLRSHAGAHGTEIGSYEWHCEAACSFDYSDMSAYTIPTKE
jgi:hypothetical protein